MPILEDKMSVEKINGAIKFPELFRWPKADSSVPVKIVPMSQSAN